MSRAHTSAHTVADRPTDARRFTFARQAGDMTHTVSVPQRRVARTPLIEYGKDEATAIAADTPAGSPSDAGVVASDTHRESTNGENVVRDGANFAGAAVAADGVAPVAGRRGQARLETNSESFAEGPSLGGVAQIVNVPEAEREDYAVMPTAGELGRTEPTKLSATQPLWSSDAAATPIDAATITASDDVSSYDALPYDTSTYDNSNHSAPAYDTPDNTARTYKAPSYGTPSYATPAYDAQAEAGDNSGIGAGVGPGSLDETPRTFAEEEAPVLEPATEAKSVGDTVDNAFAELGQMLPDEEPADFRDQVDSVGAVLHSVEPNVAAPTMRRGTQEEVVAKTVEQSSTRLDAGLAAADAVDSAAGESLPRDGVVGDSHAGEISGSQRSDDSARFGDDLFDDHTGGRGVAESHPLRSDRFDDAMFASPQNAARRESLGHTGQRSGEHVARATRQWDEPSRRFGEAPRQDRSRFGDDTAAVPQQLADMTTDNVATPVASFDESGGSSAGVALRWETPQHVNVGQTAICNLKVNNASRQPAHRVEVAVALENRAELEWSEPEHTATADELVWNLGTLAPGEEKTIRLGIVPTSEGSLQPRAVATATRAAMAKIEIMRPELRVSVLGPDESMLGQAANYTIEIENSGSGPAVDVAVELALPHGLHHPQGERLPYRVGTLEPGAVRRVQVPLTMIDGGAQRLIASARCAGMAPTSVERVVEVAKPRLQLAVEGPKLRFVDRHATYNITVHNPGPAPADNVRLVEAIPDGFRFVEASPGGMFDPGTRQVAWFVGRLDADTTARMGVKLVPTKAGEHRLAAFVQADAGVSDNAETVTRVEGTAVVALDVVDVDDPIEASGQTAYRIRLTNTGSIAAHDVQLAAQLPVEMEAIDLEGPTEGRIDGTVALFEPMDVLPAGESRVYTVHVACRKSGDARLQAFVRTAENPKPVMEEEATRVYAD
ncbi:MAG: hypothetical protein R3C10_02805 [Pirellulales bacterium]